MGTPLISGRSQWPFDKMSRAIIGNLASSFVASTRAPRSKPRSAALTASTTAKGAHPASGGWPLSPALMRQVVIAPRVEHQEAPEDLAMVSPTLDVVRDEPRHGRRIEEAAMSDARWAQARLHDAAQRPAQPGGDGNPEPLLSSPDERRRQDSPQRALQDVLRRPSGELQLAGNRRSELDERRGEEGSTDFEASGHAGPIHGDQGLVGEVEPGMVVDQPLDRVPELELFDRRRQLGIGIEALEGVTNAGRQEMRLFHGGNATQQELGADLGRIRQRAHE